MPRPVANHVQKLAAKAVPGERDGGAAGVEPGAGVTLTSVALAKGPGFGWLFSEG